jgi:RND family efflux transporter MFP subunit
MSGNLKRTALILTLLMIFSLSSCTEEKKEIPKSIEDLHKENGLPVKTMIISKSGFAKSLSFYAPLKGIKQTTEGAMLGDEILKINAKIGDYVKAGDVIVEFPKDNPALQYEQAKTALESAEKTFNRMKALLESGEISQQQYDNTETQYLVSKRNFEQLEQMLFVETPISGTVVSMPYRVGDIPKRESELFTVAQLEQMIATVNVSEKEISMLKKGMKAVAHYQGKDYEGRVIDIPLAMNQMTRSFPVEIQFANAGKSLKSGASVDITVDIFDSDSLIAIPRNIIYEENEGSYVFVNVNGIAKKQEIATGQVSGLQVEVLSGLKEGDEIINCCKNMIEDGTKIKVVN